MDTSIEPVATDATTLPAHAPEKRPGVWSGLGTVALYMALQFGLSILIMLLIGLGFGIESGMQAATSHKVVDAHAAIRALLGSPAVKAGVIVATLGLAAALMAAIVRRVWPAQWSRGDLPGFGFVQPRNRFSYLVAVALGVAVLLVGNILTQLFAGTHPINQDVSVLAASLPLGMRVLLALTVVCVAPFIEELVFRGVLLSGLARRMPTWLAAVLSAMIFGCVHLPDFKFAWYPIPALALVGLALAWMRLKSGSLWPAITLHATNNFVAVLGWFFLSRLH